MPELTCDSAPATGPGQAIEELEMCLQNHLRSHVLYLRLQSTPGGMVLQGYARSYYAKQLAQHAFMAACCLPLQANDIQVGSGL